MNENSKESNFSNASGINDPDNYSTVRDIALMSQYLINNFPDLYKIYSEKEEVFH